MREPIKAPISRLGILPDNRNSTFRRCCFSIQLFLLVDRRGLRCSSHPARLTLKLGLYLKLDQSHVQRTTLETLVYKLV